MTNYKEIDAEKRKEAFNVSVFEMNRNKIIAIQELINKRLEEL